MKRLIYLLSIIFILSSCNNMKDEPKVSSPIVHFDKNGGEKTVKITRLNGKNYSDNKAPWFYKPNKGTSILKTETLSNGDIKYFNDWLNLIVPPSFKFIKIIANKNDTKTKRSFVFTGWGSKEGFEITIEQE